MLWMPSRSVADQAQKIQSALVRHKRSRFSWPVHAANGRPLSSPLVWTLADRTPAPAWNAPETPRTSPRAIGRPNKCAVFCSSCPKLQARRAQASRYQVSFATGLRASDPVHLFLKIFFFARGSNSRPAVLNGPCGHGIALDAGAL